MSFIRITTIHPTGREVTGVTQQARVTAQEAFTRRLERLKATPNQGYEADKTLLTIHLHPTEIFDYEQLLEYAETQDGFNNFQPELPREFLELMGEP